MLRNPLARRAALALEAWAYPHAAVVITLSPDRATSVSTRFPGVELEVIPNAADTDLFSGVAECDVSRFRRQRTWLGDRPLIVYAGTLGAVNNVGYIVELARWLRPLDPDIRVLVVGTGKEREEVVHLARRRGVLDRNLFLEPAVPKRDMPALLGAADLAISSAPVKELHANSANKVFDALAAGCPVLINHGGWPATSSRDRLDGLLGHMGPARRARRRLCVGPTTDAGVRRARDTCHGRLSRRTLHAVWAWFVATGLVYFAAAIHSGPGLQGRYAALGGGPNVFVRIMVLACLGAFFLASVRDSRWILWTVPIFCAGAVLSGSRGGLVSFVVVAILGGIPLWRRMPRLGRRTVAVVALGAAPISPFVTGPKLVEELRERFVVQTLHEQYDSSRAEIAEAAFRIFENRPLLGAGLGGYHALARPGVSFDYPHNLVLATAAEGGVIGVVLLVIALGSFARTIRAGRPLATEALYATLGALYILIASMFSGDYCDSRFAWFFLGLAAIEARRCGPRSALLGPDDHEETAGPERPATLDPEGGR